MKGGWVYIMTNKPFGTLYIGVTSNLAARAYQHRTGKGSEFCRKRNWKLRQIMEVNPDWLDLYDTVFA